VSVVRSTDSLGDASSSARNDVESGLASERRLAVNFEKSARLANAMIVTYERCAPLERSAPPVKWSAHAWTCSLYGWKRCFSSSSAPNTPGCWLAGVWA
jgi:hypothetical protein